MRDKNQTFGVRIGGCSWIRTMEWAAMMAVLWIACDGSKTKTSDTDTRGGTDIPMDSPLVDTVRSDIDDATLIGEWFLPDDPWQSRFTFEADGRGEFSETFGGDHFVESFQWTLNGNLLTVHGSETEMDVGMVCEERFSEAVTVALVDEKLYVEVFVRTDGSGDTPDGTWESFSAFAEEWDCGSESGSDMESLRETFVIQGSTFQLHTILEYQFIEDRWKESGRETEETEGTMEIRDEWLLFHEDDSEPFFAMARISPNVMKRFSIDEISGTPQEALAREAWQRR